MRRVVSDQIKALEGARRCRLGLGRQLRRRRAGAADRAELARRTDRPASPGRSAARGGGAAVRVRRASLARPWNRRRSKSAAGAAAATRPPAPREDETLRLAPPRRRSNPPRSAAPDADPRPLPAPASAPAAERGQAGWLSNLLAAASREESSSRPPGAAVNGSLEFDLARHRAARRYGSGGEMWERWRQATRPAISRRLYTAAGQQAFDDLRRRYRSDPAFRESVDRYVKEFERLLAKIGQNDRDGRNRASRCCRIPARSTSCSRMRRGGSAEAWDGNHLPPCGAERNARAFRGGWPH